MLELLIAVKKIIDGRTLEEIRLDEEEAMPPLEIQLLLGRTPELRSAFDVLKGRDVRLKTITRTNDGALEDQFGYAGKFYFDVAP